jgi:hypothetical protein
LLAADDCLLYQNNQERRPEVDASAGGSPRLARTFWCGLGQAFCLLGRYSACSGAVEFSRMRIRE